MEKRADSVVEMLPGQVLAILQLRRFGRREFRQAGGIANHAWQVFGWIASGHDSMGGGQAAC
jgi:hypothetical protein